KRGGVREGRVAGEELVLAVPGQGRFECLSVPVRRRHRPTVIDHGARGWTSGRRRSTRGRRRTRRQPDDEALWTAVLRGSGQAGGRGPAVIRLTHGAALLGQVSF